MLTLNWNWLVQPFSLAYLAFPFKLNAWMIWTATAHAPMHHAKPNRILWFIGNNVKTHFLHSHPPHIHIGSVTLAFSINKIECAMGYGFSVKCRHSEQLAHCWKSMHSNIFEWQWQIFVSIPNALWHWIDSECYVPSHAFMGIHQCVQIHENNGHSIVHRNMK